MTGSEISQVGFLIWAIGVMGVFGIILEVFKRQRASQFEMKILLKMLELLQRESKRKTQLANFIEAFPKFRQKIGPLCYWKPKIKSPQELLEQSKNLSELVLPIIEKTLKDASGPPQNQPLRDHRLLFEIIREEKAIEGLRKDLTSLVSFPSQGAA